MSRFRHFVVALSVAHALALPSLANEAPDVSAYTEPDTIEVLTSDEDGETRETTIWIVVVDDAAYIRTGDTGWGGNVQRNPQVDVRLDEETRGFDVVFVEDDDLRTQVKVAFREKYGFQDKVVSFFRGSSRSLIMRLTDASTAAADF